MMVNPEIEIVYLEELQYVIIFKLRIKSKNDGYWCYWKLRRGLLNASLKNRDQ